MKPITFPPLILCEWKETRDRLHKYCRLIGAIREVLSEPLPNSLHANLLLCGKGFTTSLIPRGDLSTEQTFEVIIEMNKARLSIESNYREPQHIALTGQSLNALCDEACSLLTDIGVRPPLERPSFLEGARGQFDGEGVKTYWRSVKSTKKILEKIKLDLTGESTPVQLHVDTLNLSITWYCKDIFATENIEEIEFGFSSGDDFFHEAYFFIQSFPDRAALKKVFPAKNQYGVVYNNSKMILPYSEVSQCQDGELRLINFFRGVLS